VIPFERHPDEQPHFPGRSPSAGHGAVDPAVLGRRTVGPAASRRSRPTSVRGAWLIGPLLLAAIGAGIRLVFSGPDELFGLCFGIVLGLGVLWVLVCSLFPASADRTCPRCGGHGLERASLASTHGLVCRLCRWEDASASSFLLAEEEGALEDIVLRERRGPRRF
jgi:hypothetical protein